MKTLNKKDLRKINFSILSIYLFSKYNLLNFDIENIEEIEVRNGRLFFEIIDLVKYGLLKINKVNFNNLELSCDFVYGDNGFLISHKHTFRDEEHFRYYTYNEEGKLLSEKCNGYEIAYYYDDKGNNTRICEKTNIGIFNLYYEYDDKNNLIYCSNFMEDYYRYLYNEIQVDRNIYKDLKVKYFYDDNGRRISKKESPYEICEYVYDENDVIVCHYFDDMNYENQYKIKYKKSKTK